MSSINTINTISADNGNWLSAEQAVMPDGTQRDQLPLVNRKLPALGQPDSATNPPCASPSPTPVPPADNHPHPARR